MSLYILTDENAIDKIVEKLSDYRYPPAKGMSSEHVSKWIKQFSVDDRRFILDETLYLLRAGYLSEDLYKALLKAMARNEKNTKFFRYAGFLDIQKKGNSQKELLHSLYEMVNVKFSIVTNSSTEDEVNNFKRFVYIDDTSFSGEKVIKSITDFVMSFDLRNIKINVYLFSSHTLSDYNIKRRLDEVFNGRNILIYVQNGGLRKVENRKSQSAKSGVFWPKIESVDVPEVFDELDVYKGIYRKGYFTTDSFRNQASRDRFESILTKVGFDILQNRKTPSEVLKPLGFSTFDGLGFGGTTFTYRNCPNNVPLAFWWGAYEPTGHAALDCWYPLMRRNGYNELDEL
ncbi:hypothetical protein [Enterobacter sp. MEB024]|uniref:phosphoribosyltransferase-like protein n=1 Tax=Enterobacter sp. MEB024 TaxID=3040288 RepID=UPI00254F71BE|nr:hypothetical protein [Enterobacter sp. MEB024]